MTFGNEHFNPALLKQRDLIKQYMKLREKLKRSPAEQDLLSDQKLYQSIVENFESVQGFLREAKDKEVNFKTRF